MPEQTPAPKIGEFKSPPDNKERLQRKEPETEDTQSPEPEEKEEEFKTPEERAKTYEEGLRAVNLTKPQARLVMDALLSDGYYEETDKIGRVPVKIRTRSYADTLRAQSVLESEIPQYPMSANEVLARYNVAASVSAYGDTEFVKDGTEEEFERCLQFLTRLPSVVFSRLIEIVYQFDQKMGAVFADGAPEDF